MVYVVQNKQDLNQQLANAGEKLIVLDFYATWCGPCKIISPKLEELADEYAGRAIVLKVNVDDTDDIAVEYNITSMPTFVFIKSGEVLEIFVGGNSEKLVKCMEKYAGGGAVVVENVLITPARVDASGGAAAEEIDLEKSQAQVEKEAIH